jgi:hypothetical protein
VRYCNLMDNLLCKKAILLDLLTLICVSCHTLFNGSVSTLEVML